MHDFKWFAALALVALGAQAAEGFITFGERARLLPKASARVQGTAVTLTYDGLAEATPCATPTNCGAGYSPPRPHFTVDGCEPDVGCPLVVTDVDARPDADGTVAFTVLAVTPQRFTAALAACRARLSATWFEVPDCKYLFAIATFGHATSAQTEAMREVLNGPNTRRPAKPAGETRKPTKH